MISICNNNVQTFITYLNKAPWSLHLLHDYKIYLYFFFIYKKLTTELLRTLLAHPGLWCAHLELKRNIQKEMKEKQIEKGNANIYISINIKSNRTYKSCARICIAQQATKNSTVSYMNVKS
jgi:hypothetical protein